MNSAYRPVVLLPAPGSLQQQVTPGQQRRAERRSVQHDSILATHLLCAAGRLLDGDRCIPVTAQVIGPACTSASRAAAASSRQSSSSSESISLAAITLLKLVPAPVHDLAHRRARVPDRSARRFCPSTNQWAATSRRRLCMVQGRHRCTLPPQTADPTRFMCDIPAAADSVFAANL
jgi:hypothetical protein